MTEICKNLKEWRGKRNIFIISLQAHFIISVYSKEMKVAIDQLLETTFKFKSMKAFSRSRPRTTFANSKITLPLRDF